MTIPRTIAALLAAFFLAACAAPATVSPPPAKVRVAAASDLQPAMDALIVQWAAAHPDVLVEPTYGSSGNFLTQIQGGAPFDVFFSADAGYPRQLETAGLAATGSTRIYGIGQIVVWVRTDSALDIASRGLEALTDAAVKKVAIANPAHAPYGKAAVAAMQATGVYQAVQPKLVLGENVSQAAQFAESGNADAGIFALSLAIAPALKDKGRYVVVPLALYPKLEQGVVVLKSAADPQAAQAFVDFVLGPDGQAVLDRFGFLAP